MHKGLQFSPLWTAVHTSPLEFLLHILFLFIESFLCKINCSYVFVGLVLDFSKQLTSHAEPPGLYPTVGAVLDYNRTKISTLSSTVLSYSHVFSLSFSNIVNGTIVFLQTLCSLLPSYSSVILCCEQKWHQVNMQWNHCI